MTCSLSVVGRLVVQMSKPPADVNKPIDKQYCDTVVNFLLRIACQVRLYWFYLYPATVLATVHVVLPLSSHRSGYCACLVLLSRHMFDLLIYCLY